MKQVVQDLGNGDTLVVDVPAPRPGPREVLVRTRASVISAGTERMLVSFGQANLLDKARQQPERVRQVLDKVRADGLLPTVEAIRARLGEPLPLGYSSAGEVIAVGSQVTGFAPGDRVVSNGPHAEIATVPTNLCARIPHDTLSDEHAAFAVIGSIALQGIRLVAPTLGETVVVTGLGLIGLLAVQLLRASGCRVIGIDGQADRLALARAFGATTVDFSTADPVDAVAAMCPHGVDAVLITASTPSSEPMHQAATMCRIRGRIVLVGTVGLELQRADFYDKELSFQVSCSYGPGRYDPVYEGGQDYPRGHVRWTVQRNLEAMVDVLASGAVDPGPLVSGRVPLDEAPGAYTRLTDDPTALGLVLTYPQPPPGPDGPERTVRYRATAPRGRASVGLIGAGNFASRFLVPSLERAGAHLHTVASRRGLTSALLARKKGFARATTDTDALLADPDIDTVVIATRHDTHASLVVRALQAGKHVFVEKPLAIDPEGLEAVVAAAEAAPDRLVGIGFNRRFAPHVVGAAELLRQASGPRTLVMTVNAGSIPADSWVHDPAIGGGRIIGEACHFVDLLRHLVGHPITSVHTTHMGDDPLDDNVTITLTFADGSHGTVHYFANGHRGVSKEHLQVFAGGRILALENFQRLRAWGFRGGRTQRLLRQDKGHDAAIQAFVDAVRRGGAAPIPFDEIVEVTRATFQASHR